MHQFDVTTKSHYLIRWEQRHSSSISNFDKTDLGEVLTSAQEINESVAPLTFLNHCLARYASLSMKRSNDK